MTSDERDACTRWYMSIMSEAVGPGMPVINNLSHGPLSEEHNRRDQSSDSSETLKTLLPEDLVDRLESYLWIDRSVYTALMYLSDADTGIIMQAGAAMYLPPIGYPIYRIRSRQ